MAKHTECIRLYLTEKDAALVRALADRVDIPVGVYGRQILVSALRDLVPAEFMPESSQLMPGNRRAAGD